MSLLSRIGASLVVLRLLTPVAFAGGMPMTPSGATAPSSAPAAASDSLFADTPLTVTGAPKEGALTRMEFVVELTDVRYPPELLPECYAILTTSTDFTLLFTDVRADSPEGPSLCLGMIYGLVDGYKDGSFRPDALITFADAAQILANTFGLTMGEPKANEPWYRPAVYALAVQRAIPTSIKGPTDTVTMDEFQEMYLRLFDGMTESGSRTPAEVVKW